MTKRLFSAWIALLALTLMSPYAQGALINGNFESTFPAPGVPTAWKANTGDGNTNLQETVILSPFTNVYPAGSKSVRLADGASNSALPSLDQSFGPDAVQFTLSFDFYLDAVADAPWRFRIGSSSRASLDFLLNGANAFQYFGGTSGIVATLDPATWYQLSATIDETTDAFVASLTPFGGSPVNFAGSLYLDGPAATNQVEIRDFSANQNPTLYIDNVSVGAVPEPSAAAIFLFGLAPVLFRRLRI
jgi:hypothetical protein